MMANMQFQITDNSDEVLNELAHNIDNVLEAWGLYGEGQAKRNIIETTRNPTGRLMNSITHTTDDNTAIIGTNVEYAIWNEIGTGIYASEPGGRQDPWFYQDSKGNWHKTSGMKPKHFLQRAITEHIETYKEILEKGLKGQL